MSDDIFVHPSTPGATNPSQTHGATSSSQATSVIPRSSHHQLIIRQTLDHELHLSFCNVKNPKCHAIHVEIFKFYKSVMPLFSIDTLQNPHANSHWEGVSAKSQFYNVQQGSFKFLSLILNIIQNPSTISINPISGHILVSGLANSIVGHSSNGVGAMQGICVVIHSSGKFITAYPSTHI